MQTIREVLKKVVQDLYGLVDFDPELAIAPDNIDADYSTNAPLKLAKNLHQSPMDIANELQAGFIGKAASLIEGKADVTRTSVTPPGFLNFTLSDAGLITSITNLSNDFNKFISNKTLAGQTIICEFSDPNPFKVLHVGHLYTSVVGDAIASLYEYAGAKVIRANFGGDVGLHVAKTMYALRDHPVSHLQIEDIAKCYIKGTAIYDDDPSAHAEITKLNQQIYQINSKKLHDTPLAELYWRARELSYDYFRDFYAQIGVKFDKYYPESTVAELGLAKVQEQLAAGVYQQSDGAVIFNGEQYGLHTRVFINQAGVPTYEAKDVGLIFTKWEDYHFDKSIVITGNEQSDYMKVVLKSVEQYAPELVERTTHLTHGLVKLPGGVKMSSRKGNFLKAIDVLDMVDHALTKEYHSTDHAVMLAATKYAFLRYKMGGDIIFDPSESVKMTGNSGPYLLYACVRAKKILSKIDKNKLQNVQHLDSLDSHERELAKKLLEYKPLLDESVSEMAPHKLAGYLYELAQAFSRFYEHCPVAGSDRTSLRLAIVQLYLDIMTHGLGILGINIPEEM